MTAANPREALDAETLDAFRTDRSYLGADHRRNERRTRVVAAICVLSLALQVAGGLAFNSMALLAGGLHMAGHVAALVVAAGAYGLARRFAADPRFAFGTGKIGYLAAFANAVVLGVTAVVVLAESVERIAAPHEVGYHAALPLAGASLAINLLCAWLLRPAPRAHDHDEFGDLNLNVAHLHLTADAAVAVLAILGLGAGELLGWTWADPAAGLLGALLIAQFALTLMRRAGGVLLDMNPSPALASEIRRRMQEAGGRVLDLHLWRLGPGHHAVILVVAGDGAGSPQDYRARLAGLPGLSHVTIEVRPKGV
ncbi:MAG: cation diffusion facilitator family transporter [Phenylobacterium sp.]|uniref:cation diffusion facilitator family transporter n=1 Tax=Phenylobacterium sp. TaxID=1871053 RepID=UPI00391A6689